MNMFEVTTLGQPLEVLKTQMAANRKQSMAQAFRTVWSRGGVFGFYQGLIPWVRHSVSGFDGSLPFALRSPVTFPPSEMSFSDRY